MYFVYIITNPTNTTLYTGVTNNLVRRIYEHKNEFVKSFTKRYNLNKLIYYEEYSNIEDALNREKQIKAGSRGKKLSLIKKDNPNFEDLYDKLIT